MIYLYSVILATDFSSQVSSCIYLHSLHDTEEQIIAKVARDSCLTQIQFIIDIDFCI